MFGSINLAAEMRKLSIGARRKKGENISELVAEVKKQIKRVAADGRMWYRLYSCDEIDNWMTYQGLFYFNPKTYDVTAIKAAFIECGFTVKKEENYDEDRDDCKIILEIKWKKPNVI